MAQAVVGAADEAPPSLLEQIKGFGRPFWMANVMELLERLAYYGVRVVIPIYIASTQDPHGLHFTNTQKGEILATWAVVQSLLPMFTGGFADRYGYKRTISVAIAFKIVGYLVMATQRGYWPFLLGCVLLAVGTAVFKPGVQGTLLRGITRKNSSVGWGIFYQCVNVGGFLGPPLAGYLHRLSWPHVFFSCAGIVSLNYLSMLLYTDAADPSAGDAVHGAEGAEASTAALSAKPAWRVLVDSVTNLFRPRLLVFLVVMSGFWLMFMQLFDMLPNFIEEWTDSSGIVRALGLRPGIIVQVTDRGPQIAQEWMINLNAGCIIVLMVFIAALTARVRRLTSIFVGILVASVGLMMAGFTMSGWSCLLGIFVFSLGEMAASPKMNEYLGVVAPRGQEGLYMGYANVPIAIGWTYGTLKGGEIYDRGADKANLSLDYLRHHGVVTEVPAALVGDGSGAAGAQVTAWLQGHGMAAVAAHAPDLHITAGSTAGAQVAAFIRLHAFEQLQSTLGINATRATTLLWNTYHPYQIWYGFAGTGMAAGFGMLAYGWYARRWASDA